jgi:hypothetical protein
MKKVIISVILGLCALGLLYACFASIYNDISFDEEKAMREELVKQRLLQIRDAQDKFKQTHKEYCGTMDSLIDFVKNDRAIAKINKSGEIPKNLADEITEEEAYKRGFLHNDTVWASTAALLGIDNPDSLRYVPCGKKGAEIQMRKNQMYNMKTESFEMLLEARASLDDYLDGMDAKKVKYLKADLKERGKNRADLFEDNTDDEEGNWYGLRIGDLKDAGNKNAGNWE